MLRNKKVKLVLQILLVVLLLFVPSIVESRYWMFILTRMAINIIASLGLSVLIGFTGQMSLGHAAFFGIGAYASAIMTKNLGISFWLALPIVCVLNFMVGLIIGRPALRLKGLYLSLATLGFAELIQLIMSQWKNVTGGWNGFGSIPPPMIGSFSFGKEHQFFYIALTLTIVTVWVSFRIIHSRTGRAMIAIREDELAAESSGVNTTKYKVLAFAVSTLFAGIGGSLYAHSVKFISPDSFTINESVIFLSIVVIGGRIGSIPGTILAGIVLTLVPELLRAFSLYQAMLYGLVIIIIMNVLPDGIGRVINETVKRLKYRFEIIKSKSTKSTGGE